MSATEVNCRPSRPVKRKPGGFFIGKILVEGQKLLDRIYRAGYTKGVSSVLIVLRQLGLLVQVIHM